MIAINALWPLSLTHSNTITWCRAAAAAAAAATAAAAASSTADTHIPMNND